MFGLQLIDIGSLPMAGSWQSLAEFTIPLLLFNFQGICQIMIKYTPQFLKKIEEVFEEHAYQVRYEKGNFKSGYCLIEDRKMVVINKFAAIESRINTLLEIIKVLGASGVLSGDKFNVIQKEIDKQQKVEDEAG